MGPRDGDGNGDRLADASPRFDDSKSEFSRSKCDARRLALECNAGRLALKCDTRRNAVRDVIVLVMFVASVSSAFAGESILRDANA